jgi:hypothetical protein
MSGCLSVSAKMARSLGFTLFFSHYPIYFLVCGAYTIFYLPCHSRPLSEQRHQLAA